MCHFSGTNAVFRDVKISSNIRTNRSQSVALTKLMSNTTRASSTTGAIVCPSLPAEYLAFWTFTAVPPNQLAALQRCVVRKVSLLAVSVMVPLLQQGMVCRCKSRVLLPGAICFPAAICLCTLGAAAVVAPSSSQKSAICASKHCTSSGPSCCCRQSLDLVTMDHFSWHPKTTQLQLPF